MNIKAMVNRNKSSRKIGDSSKTRRVENHHKVMDTSLYRLLTTHADKGYIVVSACHDEYKSKADHECTEYLRGDIASTPYSYKEIQGGCKQGDELISGEHSFVVFNFLRGGGQGDFEQLVGYAVKWCGDYDQWGVLIVPPTSTNETPFWYDRYGNVTDRFERQVSIDEAIETYYTEIEGHRFSYIAYGEGGGYDMSALREGFATKKRFGQGTHEDLEEEHNLYPTYDSADFYLANSEPRGNIEEQMRMANGEIFIDQMGVFHRRRYAGLPNSTWEF